MIRGSLILLVCLFPSLLRADGRSFAYDKASWYPALETEQRAFLACDGTTQRLLVAIALKIDQPERALWMLPVRAQAKDVQLDLIDELPRVHGVDPNLQASRLCMLGGTALRATLIAPLIVDVCLAPSLNRSRGGVELHQMADRFGVHAELLSADSLDAMQAYLKGKSVDLPDDELQSFAPYFDGKHCFVASWVTDTNQLLEQRSPGVSVRFPSTSLWYPMRATSGYGKSSIPVKLFVDGFVTVQAHGKVESIDTRYFTAEKGLDALDPWIATPRSALDYTVIEFEEPAERYTEDLTFAPAAGVRTPVTRVVNTLTAHPWFGVPMMVLVLLAAFAISGAVAARVCGAPVRTGAALGLTGVFTIIAFYFVLRGYTRRPQAKLAPARRGEFFRVYATSLLLLSLLLTWLGL